MDFNLFVRKIAWKILDRCLDCKACQQLVDCPGGTYPGGEGCIGCGACSMVCPHSAIKMIEIEVEEEGREVIVVDGNSFEVPGRTTVKYALENLGFQITRFPNEEGLFMPCSTGGCWACVLEIDGELKPACFTLVKDGMEIKAAVPENLVPRRLAGGFLGHLVGGVGTPWQLKGKTFIEVVCFTVGCNFFCPQCQNWMTTLMSRANPLTPEETAGFMTNARKKYQVDRMTFTGGESTLNRRWLVQCLREVKRINSDPEARLHVDTNGSILTEDYIDELVDAGMTDIGIDLKALKNETFMRITGLKDERLA